MSRLTSKIPISFRSGASSTNDCIRVLDTRGEMVGSYGSNAMTFRRILPPYPSKEKPA